MSELPVTCPYCGDGMESIGTFHHIECVAALEAELKRWQFIGTHEYTLRRPKHLGGGPGVVDRGGWELDGLDAEFDRSCAEEVPDA